MNNNIDNIDKAKEYIHKEQAQLDSLKPQGFTINLPHATITDKDLYHMIKGHTEDFNPKGYTLVGQLIQSLLIEELCSIIEQLQYPGIIKEDYHKETLNQSLYLLSRDIIYRVLDNQIYNLRVPTLTIEILKQIYSQDLETLKY